MFKCKVCVEKDNRIAELKEQIAYLKKLYQPQETPDIQVRNLEADGILSGQQHVIEVPEFDEEAVREERSERDRILSGNY